MSSLKSIIKVIALISIIVFTCMSITSTVVMIAGTHHIRECCTENCTVCIFIQSMISVNEKINLIKFILFVMILFSICFLVNLLYKLKEMHKTLIDMNVILQD